MKQVDGQQGEMLSARKYLRQRLSEEQKELEQMQLERLRRQGPDRAWRYRRQISFAKTPCTH